MKQGEEGGSWTTTRPVPLLALVDLMARRAGQARGGGRWPRDDPSALHFGGVHVPKRGREPGHHRLGAAAVATSRGSLTMYKAT